MSSLADLLFDPEAPPDAPLLHWRGKVHSRGEIADAAQRFADTLRGMGASADSVVAALVPATPLGAVVLFGIWRAGAVAAPIVTGPPAADAEPELARLLEDLRPAVVVRPSLDDESLVPQVVVGSVDPRRFDTDVALITPGSDAAGRARRVQHTTAAVRASVASAQGTVRGWPVQVVSVSPASGAGLDALLVAVGSGGEAVLVDPASGADLADAVRRFRVESVTCTPATVAALADDRAVATLEPLRWVHCVDGVLSADDARRFRTRFGVGVLGGYGRPELGGEVVGWTVGDASVHGDVKLGSVGRPYEGVEVRIVGDDRRDVGPDEPGAVWVRSPFGMRGYVGDRFGSGTGADGRGFLHFGDHGHVDRDGFVWIAPPDRRPTPAD